MALGHVPCRPGRKSENRSTGIERFIFYVGIAFVTAFVGVSWATRGFPIGFSAPDQKQPLQPTLNSYFGDDHAKEGLRKDWEAEHRARGDDDAKRNAIRMDTLQAANAYAMSSCDETVKANFVVALSAYTRAWQTTLDCKPNILGQLICSDEKFKKAADSVTTPLDRRVKAALETAFAQKGIVTADFPKDLQRDMPQFASPHFWGDAQSPALPPEDRPAAERTMKRVLFVIWAIATGQHVLWTFTSEKPRAAAVNMGDGKPYGDLEPHFVESEKECVKM